MSARPEYDNELIYDDPLPPIQWVEGCEPPKEEHVPGTAYAAEQAYEAFTTDLVRRERGEIVGLPWPNEWPALERRMGPLEPGSLTVIAARPSIGKTTMAMQLQRYLCSLGKKVVFVSRELSVVRLMRRQVCSYGASMSRLRLGRPDERDREALERFERETQSWDAFYDDNSKDIEGVKLQVVLHQPDIIIIDYLQRFAYDTEKEYAAVTRIVNELQDLTLATDVPVVCLSQLRRPQPGMEWKVPSVSDIRGSGAVEERAANIILLHRKWETAEEDNGYGKTAKVAKTQSDEGYFIIGKCADGETGHPIPVQFDGPRFRVIEKL